MKRTFLVVITLGLMAMLLIPIAGIGQPVDEKLNSARSELEQNRAKEQDLSGKIGKLGETISGLEDEIDGLRSQESTVQNRLDIKTAQLEKLRAELEALQKRLAILREKLADSQKALSERLVALYKADEPDALTVVLEADGFNDLLERTAFLERISDQDQEIVGRTGALKEVVATEEQKVEEIEGRVAETVEQITAQRDQLAATRERKESVEGDLTSVRQGDKRTLAQVREGSSELEKEIVALEAEQAAVQSQLAGTAGTFDAGPVKQGSGQLIWPIDAAITSPFGQRWGRLHAGIDLGAGEGTPIRAAEAGRVVQAGPFGGYGNYTCIQHSGALSTCYAHQSSIGVSTGQTVDQGEVIGAVGNTGASFGAHLHFETRVNGTPQDPMGYL